MRNFSFIIFAMLHIWSNTLVVKTEYIKLTLTVADLGFAKGVGRQPQRSGVNLLFWTFFS